MSGGSEIGGSGGGAAGAAAPAPARQRLLWVDALKGLGMIAVVAAHVWTRGPVRDAIYAVHMPLFFLLSGYTASAASWRACLPRLARGLLLPFVCFSLLLLGADFLIEGLRGMRPIFPSWQAGVEALLFATATLRGPFTIFWFIPCLFIARLLWSMMIGAGQRPDRPALLLVAALLVVLALVAQSHGGRSPFGLLAVPSALLFLWLGAVWRRRLPVGAPWGAKALVVAALALATLLWLPPLNMKQGDLGWPLVSLIGAAAVTMMLALGLARLPAPALRPLIAIGRASLVIMYVHVAFIHYLAPYAPKLVLFPVALVGAWLLDWMARRTGPSRLLLRGETHASY